MKVKGACHCGAITFGAEINPDHVAVCHCTDCQSMASAPFRTMVITPEASFQLNSGRLKNYIKRTAQSGNLRELTFCDQCSTQVYATSVGDEGSRMLALRVGTLDVRADLKPSRQIWCQSRLGWLDDLTSIPGQERQ
ncbi:MAG: GFA family protein [Pseudomonadales bacterium]|jgi:hypothetical protein|nr:GFA family protein [Pseudomonadales bacterium]MDP6970261.1 GFA family protein [Pseudomonadales bacterium]